ncbi:MAG: hypothetical protein ACLSAF_08815 [Intestinimonas sp.]
MSYQIVAFGDSNTRYYLGDTGTAGPLRTPGLPAWRHFCGIGAGTWR